MLLSTPHKEAAPAKALLVTDKASRASRVVFIAFDLTYTTTAQSVKMCGANIVSNTHCGSNSAPEEPASVSLMNSRYSGAGKAQGETTARGAMAGAISIIGSVGA